MMRGRYVYAAACVVLLSGCATVNEPERFEELRAGVNERTGYEIAWAGVTAPEQALAEAVAAMFADGLTADEAAQIALLNNPRLQALYANYGIAVAELVQAGLLENPVFSGELRWEKSNIQIFEASLVEDFLRILMIPLRRAKEKTELEWARLNATAQVIDVAMDTKRAFYHYQADLQVYELWESHLLADEADFEMAVKLRAAGNIPAIELAKHQAQYEQTKSDVADAQMDLGATREQLNRLMGLWGEWANWTVAAPLPAAPETPLDLNQLEQRAMSENLDVAMGLLDVEIAARIRRIRSVQQVIPTFEIGVGTESVEPEVIELKEREIGGERMYRLEESVGDRIWEVGPALTIPIPIFDQGQAARAEGRNQIRQQWSQYTALAMEVRSAARAAAYRLSIARDRAIYMRDVVMPLMNDFMNQAQLEYNGMFIGVFDLLDAKRQEIETAQMYVMNLMDFWLAQTDMEQILMGRMVIRVPEDRPDIINANILVADDEEID